MKHTYLFFPVMILCVLLSSCNLYNPAEPVPSFIHIQNITVTTDSTVEGTHSSKITDAWVYIDGTLLGCYELPVTLPAIATGSHSLTIKAGIKVNGIAATRSPYPFYTEYNETVNLTAAQTFTVNPVVHYSSTINWASTDIWQENFDSALGMGLTKLKGSDTTMFHYMIPPHTTDPNVFEGQGVGIAYLDSPNDLFECVTSTSFTFPHGDSPVFLEMNYKCNHDFTVGIFSHFNTTGSVKSRVIDIRASTTWNKIYVYLSPEVNANFNASDYSIYFGMSNPGNENGLYLALDNLKILHY